MSTDLSKLDRLLGHMPIDARRVLDLRCAEGALGSAYLARNPLARYVAIEGAAPAAQRAATWLSQVVVGDVQRAETLAMAVQAYADGLPELLVLDDVLEHCLDPWRLVADLRTLTAAGGVCVALVRNVSHWSVLAAQLQGRWDYVAEGGKPPAPLRQFTLGTVVTLFRQAGWQVVDAEPILHWPKQPESVLAAFAALAQTLDLPLEPLQRELSASHWLIRAVNGPMPEPISIAALGLEKIAGVTEARVDYPMLALASLPQTRARWGAGTVAVPADWPAGVIVLQRQILDDAESYALVERASEAGWVVVADMDDDPHHWQRYVETDFFAFRAVHAVTVSTEPLAAMMRQWNPHVRVFANAVFALPQVPESTPKNGRRLRLFFGALNRGPDWAALMGSLLQAIAALGERIELVVVHDRDFHAALPDGVPREFHPTLPYEDYMRLLASCDLALAPLADTQFNRMKSDIKFIECCAAGAVPICSSLVYAERRQHGDIGLFADTPEQWRDALLGLCADPAEIARRRQLGKAYVVAERMHYGQVQQRLAHYRALIEEREALERDRRARLEQTNWRPPGVPAT